MICIITKKSKKKALTFFDPTLGTRLCVRTEYVASDTKTGPCDVEGLTGLVV